MDWRISKASGPLKGELTVPPDKSISHRAVMFGAISRGECRIKNFLRGEDCMSTLNAFRALGTEIDIGGGNVAVKGKGLRGLKRPGGELYLGNSGTTMRIISGILAGQDFTTVLTGDESLSRRPMKRIIDPLSMMGAGIEAVEGGDHAPLRISGKKGALTPVDYVLPVPSAQVKSCVLSAGLYADGKTSVKEPFQSRDHTERMLEYFSADIKRSGLTTEITGLRELSPRDIEVPGDISSAAFFIVGALIIGGSDLILRHVGLNSTRDGMLKVLSRMGADVEVLDVRGDVEPVGDIRVKGSRLKGTVIEPEEIPLLIDEIPVLAVAAATADGETVIRGVKELKVKETDRIKAVTGNLSRMGVESGEEGDDLRIAGSERPFNASKLDSFGDHRMAMSMAIAGLASDGDCLILDTACVSTSYPGFLEDLETVSK